MVLEADRAIVSGWSAAQSRSRSLRSCFCRIVRFIWSQFNHVVNFIWLAGRREPGKNDSCHTFLDGDRIADFELGLIRTADNCVP